MPKPAKHKKALVSVINDLNSDRRVHKTCKTLLELNFDVCLIGRKLKTSNKMEKRPYTCKRFVLPVEKGIWFYIFFNIRLFIHLLFTKSNLLYSNDLDTLLPNFLISKLKKIPLIYDSHELFTEVPELINRPKKQIIWLSLEKYIFPKLNHVITVNNSIANIYNKKYNKKIGVVKNIPNAESFNIINLKTRQILQLPEKKTIFILQGAGINIDRGAEEAVLAMQYVDNAILLIIGSGDVFPYLKQLIKQNDLIQKVRIINKMPFSELIHYTKNADIGLSLDKDTNLNYRYSLPNKLFDYINAQKPVLVSNLPEVAGIVKHYKIGKVIETHNPQNIAKTMNTMLKNKEQISIWQKNTIKAAKELTWHNEKQILKNVIKNAIE